jgi:ubiquinone/menaquinone biosynthesis C-methylase UbiE
MQPKMAVMEMARVVQKAGPYVVLEVVLPGGTLFALILYLHRTGQLGKFLRAARPFLRAASRTAAAVAFALQPAGSHHFARRRDGVELQMLAASR